MGSRIDIILKIASIFYLFLLSFSLIHSSIFYYFFNINIASYLEFTELVFLFTDVAEGLNLTVILFFVVLLLKIFSKNESDAPHNVVFHIKMLPYFFYILSILAVIIVIYHEPILWEKASYVIGTSFILSYSTFYIVNHFWEKEKKMALIYCSIIFFIIPLLFATGFRNYRSVILNQNDIEIIFEDNTLIKVKEELRYVGQTNNFLFLYDSLQNRSLVYKKDKIKSMTFPSSGFAKK